MSDNPVGAGDGRIMSVAGYQVFQAGDDGAPPIKEEPFDPEYQVALNSSGLSASSPVHQPAPISGLSGPSSMEESAAGLFDSLSSQKIRDILKNVLDNKSRELTVKNVVESLLQRNENVLSQNSLQTLKPNPRTIKPKPNGAADQNETSIGTTTIVPPRSPTSCCSIPQDDIAHISHALVEEPVIGDNGEKVNNSLRLDMVCAVGSKVMLMTSGGQSLAMDITCYWCNFCSYRSERKEALLQHIMEHRFHCKYCKYQSFSRADVIRHCNKEHDMFADTAKTLKYCTFLPDYLQSGMIREDNETGKRKAENNLDSEPNAKLAKTSEEKRAVGKGAKNTKAKDDEYEAFDMEVDEVDEGPSYPDVEGDEQDESETKVISPKKTPVPVASVPITHVIGLNSAQPLTAQSLPVLAPAPNSAFVSSPILSSVLGQTSPSVVGLVGQPLLATTSQPIISSVHSIATSQSTSGPFITNVISGQQAVAAATAGAEPITTPTPPPPLPPSESLKKQNVVTVSSGLCWNCGYCNFVTLSQSYLKIHLNAKHQGKAHKYVAMLVSSEEEMKRIKKSDAEMMNAPPGGGMVTVGGTNVTTPSYALPSSSQVVIDNAEKVSGEREEGISEEEKKKIPQTYKCAHCNFSATQYDRVKSHLLLRHQSSVMYALDMKAVKLRQKRYLFFCLKKDCEFSTKDLEDFTNHTDECTPWLDGNQDDIDTGLVKALELTRQFAAKVAGNALLGQKDHRSEKTAEYGCYYCSYVSNNNTRVKKHVLSNHKDRSPMIKDLMGDKKSKPTVYFCSYCLWESRDGSELEIHLRERHNDVTEAEKHKNPPVQQSSSPNIVDETSSSSPFLSTASSASSENEDEQGDLDFDGNIPEEEIERAMEAYITDEASRDMQSGRPVRASAIRAQVKVRAHGHTPTLYMCIHCQEIAFGANLIRKHIRNMHKKQPLRAIDVKRKINHQQNLTCICPKEGCQFVSQEANEMLNHATKEHSLPKSDPDLTKLQEKFVPPANVFPSKGNASKNSATEVYECLYCSTSIMFHSKSDIKEHMLVKHSTEEFIYRDVVAWKNKQASRFYLCVSDQCSYSTTEQKDYTIHTLAHQNAHIYECAKCQWFTAERNLVSEHVKQMHSGEQVTTMEIDLTVDANGEVVKMVGGTIIKQEM
ncbi:hypothetical protein CHS0354_017285 [Potamilus streckersoni]|uniref:C2H2-type domain-containing protein n=1 Tax=Potamilus streckersoni TaxID=2493646 RepID=A0AAE0SF27_9BIVA|nr:hypothetical protein CHS0354_017285 [Potamilus streckersoni]